MNKMGQVLRSWVAEPPSLPFLLWKMGPEFRTCSTRAVFLPPLISQHGIPQPDTSPNPPAHKCPLGSIHFPNGLCGPGIDTCPL